MRTRSRSNLRLAANIVAIFGAVASVMQQWPNAALLYAIAWLMLVVS
jgi:hypothetical protein